MDTKEILAGQKVMYDLDRQAFEEARDRYQAQVHELRRAHELDCQATDRALAARVLELNERQVALEALQKELDAKAAYLDSIMGQLKGLLPT